MWIGFILVFTVTGSITSQSVEFNTREACMALMTSVDKQLQDANKKSEKIGWSWQCSPKGEVK